MSNHTPPDAGNWIIKVLSAFRPGDVVFLEVEREFSAAELLKIRRALEISLAGNGVKVVILPRGFRVVGREEQPSSPAPPPKDQT